MEPVGSLSILLTSGCNLSCRYCYRKAGSAGSLAWDDLLRTLDWALPAPGGELELVFSGGEPLLEFDLLKQAVTHVQESPLARRPVRFRVLTNGLLMDGEKLSFLATNGVEVNLSFDGVEQAQEFRQAGSWQALDRLLDDMRDLHPGWFAGHCQVTLTLTPENLGCLADSVAYLLGKEVPRIGISAALSRVPGWDDDHLAAMDRQFGRVAAMTRRVFRESGRVPLMPLRKYREEADTAGPRRRGCSALGARHPVLDVDGNLYSCLMFAPSGLDDSDGRLVEISEEIRLGRAGQSSCEEFRQAFPSGMKNSRLFNCAPELESRYGKCADCREAATCMVCPLSLLEFGTGRNPTRVPAFLCAYHLVKSRHLRKFPVQEDPNPPRVTAESINERMEYWASRHEKSPETAAPGD